MKINSFTSIDFETAISHHICAVGIVTVENGKIIDEFSALIQPPNNEYFWRNIDVHGIYPEDTENAPFFNEVYPEIKKRLFGKTIVAHNEPFDRSVLQKTMTNYGFEYSDLNIAERWECTHRIHGEKLDLCCHRFGIELNHHEALSDARACAMLYLKQ